ncbi:sugar transferase [Aureimonas sp. Leaf454]|uniref:sugar transferase n=1 Tax=Aureimonas sp. Leaf454 TaxID=1736381 RepID=UPI000A5B1E32|nr:sugar transferase [Aureimonas sp. Leaf454]
MSLANSDLDIVTGPSGRPLLTSGLTSGTGIALAGRASAGFAGPPSPTDGLDGLSVDRLAAAGKAAFDAVASAVLLLIALPIITLLAALIWSLDGHSPFYAQPRVGRHGVVFRVWKLRSMHVDADARLARHLESDEAAAEEWRRCFKLTRDPRILPFIGNLIRRSSLDELPQLWNVLCGEMSLVGPRPFPSYHLAAFSDEFRQLRCSVMPGLTGLWQIQARSDGSLSDQEDLDTRYIRHRSFRLDLLILLRTLPAILSARGAR